MEIIDNVNKTLKEDLAKTLTKGSKIAIAASCFSIYAFQTLKKELEGISELRFIFSSPTFTTEKAKAYLALFQFLVTKTTHIILSKDLQL